MSTDATERTESTERAPFLCVLCALCGDQADRRASSVPVRLQELLLVHAPRAGRLSLLQVIELRLAGSRRVAVLGGERLDRRDRIGLPRVVRARGSVVAA